MDDVGALELELTVGVSVIILRAIRVVAADLDAIHRDLPLHEIILDARFARADKVTHLLYV